MAYETFEFWLIVYVVVVSVISYLQFGWDKYCALRGGWRISESALLFTAMVGGALGGQAGAETVSSQDPQGPFSTSSE